MNSILVEIFLIASEACGASAPVTVYNGVYPNNTILYTSAQNISVKAGTNCQNIQHGNNNITIMGKGTFHPESAVTPGFSGASGNMMFVSFDGDAVQLDSSTKSTVDGHTLGYLSESGVNSSTTTYQFAAGAVSLAPQNGHPINLSEGLMFGHFGNTIGRIETDGMNWGSEFGITRVLDRGDGGIKGGFGYWSANYSNKWLDHPPPGVEGTESSMSHSATVEGFSVEYVNLSDALASVQEH